MDHSDRYRGVFMFDEALASIECTQSEITSLAKTAHKYINILLSSFVLGYFVLYQFFFVIGRCCCCYCCRFVFDRIVVA